MKQTINQSIRYLLGAMMLFGVSCIRDKYPTEPGLSDDSSEMTVELRLQTLDGQFGGTRSTTYDRERTVSNAVVLFFRGGDSRAPLYGVSEGHNLPTGTSSGTVTFQASLVVESAYANDAFTCVVLANMLDRTLATNINGLGTTLNLAALRSCIGMTYDEVQALLKEAVSGAMLTGTNDLFPMYGRASSSLIPSQAAAKRLSVSLIRSVARVQLYNTATTDFTLEEAYVFRATDHMSLLPLSGAFNSGSATVVAMPSVPSGSAPLASTAAWRYEVSGNKSEGTIYLPEADTHFSNPSAAPGDANHTERCALVVGGSYKGGATSYYRIDFTTGSGNTRTLLDVLRNHSYNITISAVRSAGEESPEDAYESLTTDIDASVIEWTDENQDIVFDGANWASVNRKRIEFADGADLEALLNVLSNMKPSEWTMSLDGASPAPSGTTGVAPTTDATITGTYFSVTKPADSADGAASQGGDLVIRTLQANTSSSEDTEEHIIPGIPYEETLHIYIGRLEIIVTLVQNPYEDIPWEDGGEFEGEF